MLSKSQKNRLRKNRRYDQIMGEFRKNGCVKCGDRENLTAHHIDPKQKEYSIADLKAHGITKLLQELSKCVCVCRHCHDIIHNQIPRYFR